MGKLSDAKISISLFSVGCILLMTLSMIGCATTPVDYKKSRVDYALTAKSKSVVDHALIAKNYCEKGLHDEAIQNAKQGIALNPAYASNWYWLGVAYYGKGQHEEAIQPFKKVIELKPEGLLQSSYYFLGNIYHQKGNYDEAIMYLNKAIELTPMDSVSLDMRGWSYYQKGSYNEAIRDFNKAIEGIKPEEKTALQSALRGKAFSYLGLGDGETAINLVKQSKAASDYDNNYDLSLIYYVTGNKEKAWEFRGGKGAVGIVVREYKKGDMTGAAVDMTMLGGPAEKSGIMAGDVIIKLNNAQVLSMMDFIRMVAVLEP
ncbi:MAG: tetratricopeptide repeat protein, partial [Proteobacteria bacterium]|nr:tetratricopeptide repeat protein [Pseudomonadota bacterium]